MAGLNLMGLKSQKREQNDWNDWGGYMQSKIRKLDEQFNVMENSDDKESIVQNNLFKDIVIFVNGYTVPSSDQLKRLMKQYGGGYQHYYSKSKCTHIIATNLPDSKIKELRSEKVVHPDWIVESIKVERLLPYHNYLLYGAGRKYGEKRCLKNVFRTSNEISEENDVKLFMVPENSASLSKGSENFAAQSEIRIQKTDGSPSKTVTCEDKSVLSKSDDCVSPQLTKESNAGSSEIQKFERSSEMAHDIAEFADTDVLGSSTACGTLDENCVNTVANSVVGENRTSESVKGHAKISETNLTKKKTTSCISENNNTANQTLPQRSTGRKHRSVPKAGDANFVSDFYSHSRLHYLSTWGAEFRDFINNLIQTTELKTPKRSPQKTTLRKRIIMHIDMDSFFVSVALRSRPELRGKPVAVCHAGKGGDINSATDSSFGSTSEIASCSYEARSLGVRNGMWLGRARQLCPNIVCVPYQFNEYRQVSQQLYEILASHTHEIQAVSCDEAFVDLTNYTEAGRLTPLEISQTIREEIQKKTSCPASAGIASNILLARMCTKVAKPNGQFHLQDENTAEFIGKQKVADLPGVGYALNQKLQSLNVVTCTDLQRISISVLRREFGQKTGEMLYKYCRGHDDRPLMVERERKSVSAEINYAMRFEEESEPEKFIYDLSNEVHRRLTAARVKGKQVTLKLRVRQKGAPINPTKFMGCGRCDNISRSTSINSFTDNASIIAKECISMLKQLSVAASDIRGMGIHIGKLSDDIGKKTLKTLHSFMQPIKAPAKVTKKESDDISVSEKKGESVNLVSGELSGEACHRQTLGEESAKLTSDGVSKDNEDSLQEFSLVLSDDEEDLCDPQDKVEVTEIRDARPNTRQELPPLPVFPIFSPKSTSPSSRKSSPNFTKKKRTPKKSPVKSPKKSPAKLSSQRNLHPSFQNLKGPEVIETLALPSPSQIDPAVFAVLPEEVKKDIEISYQQRNQKFQMRALEKHSSTSSCVAGEMSWLPVVPTKSLKHNHERNEKTRKKSKVKHKSIKKFASKKPYEDDSVVPLDASVLEALPESIRHEVQLAYEQQKRHDEKEKEKQLNQNRNASSELVKRWSHENEMDTLSMSSTKISLAGVETLSDVKEMLKMWTNDAQVPLYEDGILLVEYLNNLIFHKDLEKMWLVLKFYRRLVSSRERWQPLFNTVLDHVQLTLKQNYGGHLPVEHFVIT